MTSSSAKHRPPPPPRPPAPKVAPKKDEVTRDTTQKMAVEPPEARVAGSSGAGFNPAASTADESSSALDKGTRLGLGIPEGSDISQVSAPIEVSKADMRSTRPAWIDAALAGAQAPKKSFSRVQLVPGQTIPETRYRVDRWLGDGGMGQVYEATHVDLERKVALKVLRPEASRLAEASEMFREEARRAGKIGSRYIAEVFDFAELPDGRLMFAMELLQGQSVARELASGPMPAERVIAILRQVCKGLAAAHETKIIHRDVKPENIMLVERDGRADAVKLLDFGISTVYDESAGAGGHAAGTAHYVAPELVSGVPYGPRVDMYALGCMAYEMLTGTTPFEADSVEAMLVAHVQEEVPPMASRNPSVAVPAALERVVVQCMAKRPRKRFKDMLDLEAALCEAQIEAGLLTAWDDLPLPEVEPTRRQALERNMPDPRRVEVYKQKWFWPVVAVLASFLALGFGITAYVVATQASDEELSEIETLTLAARAEAAHAYFVYPPSDQPQGPTAYGKVRQLESLGSRDAAARGTELRTEFADTLVRLGDQYWGKPGGKPFSLDYYAQALVFDPDNAHASERAGLTPGQLKALQEKAESGQFSSGELATAAMLAALAEQDEERRKEKMTAIRDLETERSALANQQIDELIEEETGEAPKPRRRDRDTSDSEEAQTAEEVAADEVALAEDGTTGGAEEAPDLDEQEPQYDEAGSKRLSDEGWKALRAGQTGKARSDFQRATVADRRNAEAHAGLAKISFDEAKYSSAAQHAKRAARYAPRNADYRIRLGDSYFKLFRYQDALAQYERAAGLGHAGAEKRIAKAKSKL